MAICHKIIETKATPRADSIEYFIVARESDCTVCALCVCVCAKNRSTTYLSKYITKNIIISSRRRNEKNNNQKKKKSTPEFHERITVLLLYLPNISFFHSPLCESAAASDRIRIASYVYGDIILSVRLTFFFFF